MIMSIIISYNLASLKSGLWCLV